MIRKYTVEEVQDILVETYIPNKARNVREWSLEEDKMLCAAFVRRTPSANGSVWENIYDDYHIQAGPTRLKRTVEALQRRWLKLTKTMNIDLGAPSDCSRAYPGVPTPSSPAVMNLSRKILRDRRPVEERITHEKQKKMEELERKKKKERRMWKKIHLKQKRLDCEFEKLKIEKMKMMISEQNCHIEQSKVMHEIQKTDDKIMSMDLSTIQDVTSRNYFQMRRKQIVTEAVAKKKQAMLGYKKENEQSPSGDMKGVIVSSISLSEE
ncbi:hypothetical protein BDB01DRAFT_806394 [Pilobolus umbonatus]|nr:hypothetical protein BDB01DRAFT_806394 [Pilobolus umbonatus]